LAVWFFCEVNLMTAHDETKLVSRQLDLMIQLLGSIRVLLVTGVPRDALPGLRDDLQSLTSAVQILSGTLKRRSEEKTSSAASA
jgi:hypothetical protein